MSEFKATDKWYQDAAESESGHDFEAGGSRMSEWIRVSERLPKKDGRYLVCVPYGTSPSWIGVSSLRQGEFDDSSASHWMTLPEPPK